MIGKAAVGIAVQSLDRKAHFAQHRYAGLAARAVAAVDHDLESARAQAHAIGHLGDIRCQDVDLGRLAAWHRCRPGPGLVTPDALKQNLDLGAEDGARAAHDLEAVVFLGVVAGRDHHAAVGFQMKDRKVKPRRVQHAHIRHSEARIHQPCPHDRVDARGREPAIAAKREVTRARFTQMLCDGIGQLSNEGIGEILVRDAADVVLAKYSWVHGCV